MLITIKNELYNQMILNIMFLWCGRELYCYAQIVGECNHGRVFHQFCSLLSLLTTFWFPVFKTFDYSVFYLHWFKT